MLQTKSGKKLIVFSVVTFLLITVLVFFGVCQYCGNICLNQMDDLFGEIPGIAASRENELLMRSRVYEEDLLARAELGLTLYQRENKDLKESGEPAENELTDQERLEQIRRTVLADSVSLVDEKNAVLSSTGPVTQEEKFLACIQTLEPRQAHLEITPVLGEDGENAGKNDGKGFVRLPLSGNAKSSLVFEFSCDALIKLRSDINDFSGVFERLFSGREAIAYARTDGRVTGYPLDSLTDDQKEQLFAEVEKVFENSGSVWTTGDGRPVRIVTLLGRRYLAAQTHTDQENADILLTIPLNQAIGNSIFIALSISAIIAVGMILLQIYLFRWILRKKTVENAETLSRSQVCRGTLPGILAVLAVTAVFTVMLLQLENRTTAAVTAMNKREDVQYRIELNQSQENTIRGTFTDCYRTRAQILASFLTEHPEYRTRAGLAELSRAAKTEYLMCFDSSGEEIVSSNSYTGFSIEKNLGGEYRAVLLGYPYAVAEPSADPYTGRMQLGAAVLMTDGKGNPTGSLLAVYSAGDLSAEIRRMGYAKTVSSYPVQEGTIAAAVGSDGTFIAHTDPEMIGQKAEAYLPAVTPGTNFEGFTEYNGKHVCLSAAAEDGKTLLFIVPERGESNTRTGTVLAALVVLLILALVYDPTAGLLIAKAMTETKEKQPQGSTNKPMKLFSGGYAGFLTLFAFFVLIASSSGWWTSFDYVFSGHWSKGINLYSLWAAILILAVTVYAVFLIRTVLNRLEQRLSHQGKTVARLAGSLVTYLASFSLIFVILTILGVDTKVLLASAGIISIAVGMGAQSMAADLLAGFFMMLEGTVHVGDYVMIQKLKGRVTDMGMRMITVTDDQGNVVTLNNSKAAPLCNMGPNPKLPEQDSKPEGRPGAKPEADDDD